MSVGVMKDYKLRDLRASHTLKIKSHKTPSNMKENFYLKKNRGAAWNKAKGFGNTTNKAPQHHVYKRRRPGRRNPYGRGSAVCDAVACRR
jgi:hypothetical protein